MIKLNVKIAVTSTERREEGVEFGKVTLGLLGWQCSFLIQWFCGFSLYNSALNSGTFVFYASFIVML